MMKYRKLSTSGNSLVFESMEKIFAMFPQSPALSDSLLQFLQLCYQAQTEVFEEVMFLSLSGSQSMMPALDIQPAFLTAPAMCQELGLSHKEHTSCLLVIFIVLFFLSNFKLSKKVVLQKH